MVDSAPLEDQDFSAWVDRSKTDVDVASQSSALGLAAVLDRPMTSADGEDLHLFPLGHWLQFLPREPMSDLGSDGHPKLGDFMPSLGLPRRMWAGSTVTFHAPITAGQRLHRTTTIESITPKTGSSGRLCFVVLHHSIAAEDRLAVVERQTLAYREAVTVEPSAPSPQRPPRTDTAVPEGWEWSRTWRPSEITLFRYSALTFNSHRIHYDHPYATSVEGYPGLVVHGPLSATYMLDAFLQRRPDADVTAFEFSARSPVFANEQIHVVGQADGPGVESLEVIAPGGATALRGRVKYR